jgi:GWxTD domain-containing protein
MKMKTRIYCILSLILVLSAAPAAGQLFGPRWKSGPEYKVDYVIKPGQEVGKGELEVRISIPYDEILFVKKNANYKGHFDISIMLFEGKKKHLGENWIERLELNEFRMTNSRKESHIMERRYSLEPAAYRMEVVITDLRTQNRRKIEKEIDMQTLRTGPWMIGDLYIIDDGVIETKDGSFPESIYIGFTASGVEGTYPFTYTIFSGRDPVKHAKFDIDLIAQRHEYYFPVLTRDLNYNQYRLILKTSIDGHDYERAIPIRISWSGSSALIPNLPEAIEQMRYLSHTGFFPMRTYRRMQTADKEEQKTFFTEFWDSVDPTPDTERNELMNEYYFRIQTANQRFSGQREGWRSDRGMIYVIYGEPDAVEEHFMQMDTKPYIIWYYYSVNRRFIFIDYTGFGDYQLSEPLSEF